VDGIVLEAEDILDFIKEFGMLTRWGFRHRVSWLLHPERVDNRHRAKLPENPSNIILLSGQKGLLIHGSAHWKWSATVAG
jgi:hypothetical protein